MDSGIISKNVHRIHEIVPPPYITNIYAEKHESGHAKQWHSNVYCIFIAGRSIKNNNTINSLVNS